MCDQIVVLARLDHRRWIGCCEHGTVHLTWDSVSVRLPLSKLRAINCAVQECAQVAQHYRIAGTGDVCVVYDQYDLYQVWCGGVGLCLAPADMQLFCQLLRAAGEHEVTSAGAHPSPREDHGTPDEAAIRTTYHLFSLN